jgi:hypothetical protein
MDLRQVGWGAQTGLIWLRIGTGGSIPWFQSALNFLINGILIR